MTGQLPATAVPVGEDVREPAARDWVAELRSSGPQHELALAELHALLVRAARHQVWRMRPELGGASIETIENLIDTSADDAMVSVLRRLSSFEGRSRFTTWAYKFAIVQATSDVHRFTWRDREVALDDVDLVADRRASPSDHAEANALARAVADAMGAVLTEHQRRIAVALLVDGVPIDVLAERLGSNRGALYKTLHDVRTRLRTELTRRGYLPTGTLREDR